MNKKIWNMTPSKEQVKIVPVFLQYSYDIGKFHVNQEVYHPKFKKIGIIKEVTITIGMLNGEETIFVRYKIKFPGMLLFKQCNQYFEIKNYARIKRKNRYRRIL